MQTDIQATGTRGFLKWLQQDQPAIYARVAPQLPQKAPQLFSDFEAAGGPMGAYQRRLAGLGDDSSTGLIAPIDLSAATDTTSSIPTVDVADAANSTAPDGSTANWLSSLIGGIGSAYMSVTQAQTNQQIVNAQLQRAQAGLPPLAISSSASGIPTITAGLSSTNWLLIGGGLLALGALFLFSGKR